MAKSKTTTQKKMITKFAIVLAVVIHGTTVLYMSGGLLPLGGLSYPGELAGDVFAWLFTMFFVVRAVHRPWREARIAAGVAFGILAVIGSFVEPLVPFHMGPWFLAHLVWIVATFFWARKINRRVKKEEKKKKKREKKRQAAEQHAQEPVEQPVQESVEEHAQAPVEQHTEEE